MCFILRNEIDYPLTALTFNGVDYYNVTIEVHGGSSRGKPKKSYRLDVPPLSFNHVRRYHS